MRRRLARAGRASGDDRQRAGDLSVLRRERPRRRAACSSAPTCTARRSPTTRSCSTSSGSSATRTCSSPARSAPASRRSSRRTSTARRCSVACPGSPIRRASTHRSPARSASSRSGSCPAAASALNPIARDGRLGRAAQTCSARSPPARSPDGSSPRRKARCARRCATVNAATGDEPTLPAVVVAAVPPDRRRWPSGSSPRRERSRERTRDVALGLQRLCEGDLRGMFDGADDARPAPRRPRGRPRPLRASTTRPRSGS